MSGLQNKPTLPLEIVPGASKQQLDEILHAASLLGASDVLLQTGDYVMFSIYGRQHRASQRLLQQTEIEMFVGTIYGANGVALIMQGTPIDTRYEIRPSRTERIGFRVNIIPVRVDGNSTSISITMRVLPKTPLRIEDIGVPREIVNNALPRNGLVVVAGVTSSGKSTLLAGLIRYAYELKADSLITPCGRKIATYEAPIEYVYDGLDSIAPKVSQTEIGESGYGLRTWHEAVETAMRRALSIVLIGECRDGKTIDGCINMALTGHCTLTTVHADRVGVAFRRMVAMASSVSGEVATERLLGSLSMIVVQALCPSKDGKRVALREWLPISRTLQEELFELPPSDIAHEMQKEVIRRGTSIGHNALWLYNKDIIGLTEACAMSGMTRDELFALEVNEERFCNFS